jgi:hypothetical protein
MEVERKRLRPPRIEVLGVYRLPISPKLIRAQTGHFSRDWVAANPEDAMSAAREELEETVLVELYTHGRDERFNPNDFTQQLELPHDQWQAAWMEVCLSDDGTALQSKPFDPWPPSRDLRVAFYMHLWDPERPLETSYGPVVCPRRLRCRTVCGASFHTSP